MTDEESTGPGPDEKQIALARTIARAFPNEGFLHHQASAGDRSSGEKPLEHWLSFGQPLKFSTGVTLPENLPLPSLNFPRSEGKARDGSPEEGDDFSFEAIYEGLLFTLARDLENPRIAQYFELADRISENLEETLMRFGSRAARDGELGDALRYFLAAAIARPGKAEPSFNLGVCCHQAGEARYRAGEEEEAAGWFSHARAAFQKSLDLDPGRHQAEYFLGIYASARGDREEARRRWGACREKAGSEDEKKEIEKLESYALDLHEGLEAGVDLWRNGDLNGAEEALTRFVEKHPGEWRARSALGAVLNELGRHDEALAQHRRAVQANPEAWETWRELGHGLMRAGAFPEALSAFREAYGRKPGSAALASETGRAALACGDALEAGKWAEAALELDGQNAEALALARKLGME